MKVLSLFDGMSCGIGCVDRSKKRKHIVNDMP